MQGPIFYEIKEFYHRVRNEGIYWSEYIQYKKYLRNKIDDKVEDLLSLNKYLWLQGKITKQQYTTMQLRIANSRAYYVKIATVT